MGETSRADDIQGRVNDIDVLVCFNLKPMHRIIALGKTIATWRGRIDQFLLILEMVHIV